MQLTKEQEEIIQSTGDIKINAVAGSGKTTTIIEYARTRPSQSKILYLAFNKSVKLEATRKFEDKALHNVKVETAHSLAYRHIIFQHKYKVKAQGYQTKEIVDLLHLKGNDEKHTEYIIANHINKCIAYFCNSDKSKLQDLNYLESISDAKAKSFVSTFYEYIISQARVLLSKMDKGKIEVTHDFYLKKFQLSNPVLSYDYILFDEGQDASAAMLDVFLKQKATKVIVGDTHQQIYGWRYAVNSLEKVNFKNYYLSTSFRFSQDIASLAVNILNLKNKLAPIEPIPIVGIGNTKTKKSKAIIARTNLGLLLKAIEYVKEGKKVKHIYFEGNIHSYTYADEGASLYDILNLYNGKLHLIRDPLIKSMKNVSELKEYIEKTEDAQLGMMLEIVIEYGNDIPEILKTIKEKHVPNEEKEKAEMIFSTVHRCKGMEYDSIQLVNDFITESKIEKAISATTAEVFNTNKINEEINLLYVAITRTKNSLHIPEALLPAGFPSSTQIHALKEATDIKPIEDSLKSHKPLRQRNDAEKPQKAYSFTSIRETHKDAYKPWTQELDLELTMLYCEGLTIKDLAKHFGRTKGSIEARINKLELEDLYG